MNKQSGKRQDDTAIGKLANIIKPVVDRYNDLTKERKIKARDYIRKFNRNHSFNNIFVYLSFFAINGIAHKSCIWLFINKSGFHIHAILFFNDSKQKVFMPHEILANAWKRGFADIGQPINEREIRMYLTPHISNNVTDKNFKMHQKALLQMELPAGTNLYSYSKGIKKPQIWTDNYGAIKQYLKENKKRKHI